jgi:hypothetical protein
VTVRDLLRKENRVNPVEELRDCLTLIDNSADHARRLLWDVVATIRPAPAPDPLLVELREAAMRLWKLKGPYTLDPPPKNEWLAAVNDLFDVCRRAAEQEAEKPTAKLLEPAVRPAFSVELPEPEPAETPSEPEPLTAERLATWGMGLAGFHIGQRKHLRSFSEAWQTQNAKSAAEVERLKAELADMKADYESLVPMDEERKAWWRLVNDAERAAGFMSVAVHPSARSLVEWCDATRQYNERLKAEVAELRSVLERVLSGTLCIFRRRCTEWYWRPWAVDPALPANGPFPTALEAALAAGGGK